MPSCNHSKSRREQFRASACYRDHGVLGIAANLGFDLQTARIRYKPALCFAEFLIKL